jgi:hypothetical protein
MRKIIVLAAALAIGFAGVALGQSRNPLSSVQMLAAATTTATGEAMQLRCDNRAFQAMGTTTAGSGSAVIVVEASNKLAPVTGDKRRLDDARHDHADAWHDADQ